MQRAVVLQVCRACNDRRFVSKTDLEEHQRLYHLDRPETPITFRRAEDQRDFGPKPAVRSPWHPGLSWFEQLQVLKEQSESDL